MIWVVLNYNRKGYFLVSLSTLIILPVHAFEAPFQQNPHSNNPPGALPLK